ncbi:hypothetical protein AB4072_11970 [Microvirga sp. 2MCAF38]|uniref:hypothetical protein n=1 Tax=Microvirga sp. 2MCAF38 TaxID=3232989 RepID=UPI003F9432A9
MATVSSAALSGFPNASNTGVPAGVTLTSSGSLVINTPGTVIRNLDIKGTVTINAANVTLENCKISANSWAVIDIRAGGATIKNCDIDGQAAEGVRGISGAGTFIGNNIHNVEDGIYVTGSGTIIQDNYIHDLQSNWSGPHYDGVAIDGNVSNVKITHNTIINDHTNTSAVMIDNYFGPISNIAVDNNYLAGGGYTIYSDGQFSGGAITGVSFTNNFLGKGQWGYASFNKNTPYMSGNTEGMPGDVPPGGSPNPTPTPTPTPDPAPTDPTTPPTSTEKVIKGGWGNDVLTGSSSTVDKIFGYNGNDKLNGKGGNDILSGGVGKDTFIFDTKLNKSTNVDKITDFNPTYDTIQLSKAIFTNLKAGTLASSEFRIGDKALDADDHIIYNNKTGAVYYDADGNGSGAAVQFATISNLAKLTKADFFIV